MRNSRKSFKNSTKLKEVENLIRMEIILLWSNEQITWLSIKRLIY
jgi:hypothetical protein